MTEEEKLDHLRASAKRTADLMVLVKGEIDGLNDLMNRLVNKLMKLQAEIADSRWQSSGG